MDERNVYIKILKLGDKTHGIYTNCLYLYINKIKFLFYN